MKNKLVNFLEKKLYFSKHQYGFRKGLNTESALIEYMSRVFNGINEGKKVTGLFLDIAKAFDTVNHKTLLKKLHNCGIRGIVFKWFESYLSNRRQCVRIDGELSGFGQIKHGVPQGSVLGSLLFLVYINDLCKGRFHGQVTSFADDTALCYVGENWDDLYIDINKDLISLRWWFWKNNMILSAIKTNYVNFSLRGDYKYENKICYKCLDCVCKGNVCETKCNEVAGVDYVKYLGVILDKDLNWKRHISALKIKTTSVLRLFYLLRKMCSDELLRTIYFSLVHSRLDYAIECWGGTYLTSLKAIITIQKKFIRIIKKKSKFDSSRPLFMLLEILPLKSMFVYKVLNIYYLRSGNIPHSRDHYRKKLRSASNVFVPRPFNTHFTKTYDFLAPRMFNNLPQDIRNQKTRALFKRNLRNWLLTEQNMDLLLSVSG